MAVKWHFTNFSKRETMMKNPIVIIIKQHSRINSCVEYLLMWRHRKKRWLGEEFPVFGESVGVNLSILVNLWRLANKAVLAASLISVCFLWLWYIFQPIYHQNKKTGNMSSSIIAPRDVNEHPPIVVVLGGCTSIKISVRFKGKQIKRKNRFKGKHVL